VCSSRISLFDDHHCSHGSPKKNSVIINSAEGQSGHVVEEEIWERHGTGCESQSQRSRLVRSVISPW
jgi:hypothetical protein